MYFWYIAKPSELFCDLDLTDKTKQRLLLARARLRGAKKSGRLSWEKYYFYQSHSRFHYHLMVKLSTDLPDGEANLWESRFCDDLYRNNLNRARNLQTGRSWSLLISPVERRSYWRPADYTCDCPGKHREEVMAACPVAKSLKGCTLGADHFGNPIKETDDIVLGRGCEW